MSLIPLSAQDSSYVYGEDERIPLHVGGLGFIEGAPLRDAAGALDMGRIRSAIEGRLHLLPLFRKKLVEVPLGQGRPVWADDPRFRIENHVREVALPKPGSQRQLLDLMGRMQAQLLNRHRPLWEVTFVDGLEGGGGVAMIPKIHHSVVDGAAGVALAKLLFDAASGGAPAEGEPWEPEPEPGTVELLADAMGHRVSGWMSAAGALLNSVRDPSVPLGLARDYLRVQGALMTLCDPLPFNQRVGALRCFETLSVPLDKAMATKDRFGVTLNELVLAAVAGALRAYCEEHGIDPDELSCIRAICPVDVRSDGDERPGSQVASIFVELPVAEPGIRERVERAAEQSRYRKASGAIAGASVWDTVTSTLSVPLLRLASRFQYRGLMGQGNLLVSNIPGPPEPLYCFGGVMRSFFPYFGVQDPVGLTLVLFSYQDQLHIGASADPELMPDLQAFTEMLHKEFSQLSTLS